MIEDKLINLFVNNQNKNFSVLEIANIIDVCTNQCKFLINKLIEEGYNIQKTYENYYFYSSSDFINIYDINYYCNQTVNALVLNSVDSTNTYIKSNNQYDLVVAKEQVAGRGRRGKSFTSAFDKGIYMSYMFDREVDVLDISIITVCAVLAVRKSIFELYKVSLDIKWLNDLYFNNKKICGILTQATIDSKKKIASKFTIGIGINIYDLDDTLKDFAISLDEVTNDYINRNIIIASIINHINNLYDNYTKKQLIEEYCKYLFIVGKTVFVEESGTFEKVNVVGIDDSIRLVVKTCDGKTRKLHNGMVSLKI